MSGHDEETLVSLKGDGSCTWFLDGDTELVFMKDVKKVITSPIDLISINIEGGEYNLLSEMIKSDAIKNCRIVQIQFHNIHSGCETLRDNIREKLKEAHHEVYNYPFVWECWSKNSLK